MIGSEAIMGAIKRAESAINISDEVADTEESDWNNFDDWDDWDDA